MYPYLIASLPRLELGATPPLRRGELLERCRAVLPEGAVHAIRAALADAPTDPVGRRYHAFDVQIRNAVARARARALHALPDAYLRAHDGYRSDIDGAVAAAFEETDPRARERALDELRWRLLAELAASDAWGQGAVVAYALRLRLAERWAAFDDATGTARLDALLARLEAARA